MSIANSPAAHGGAEVFDINGGQRTAGNGLFPFAQVRAIAPAHALDMGSGGRTESDIVAAGPIQQIVPAFLAGGSVVADFIGGQAGLLAVRVWRIHVQCERFFGRAELAEAFANSQRGVGFVGQLVAREMRGSERQGLLKRIDIRRQRLAGDGVDEIDIETLEPGGSRQVDTDVARRADRDGVRAGRGRPCRSSGRRSSGD